MRNLLPTRRPGTTGSGALPGHCRRRQVLAALPDEPRHDSPRAAMMTEPSREEMFRAVTALGPFVRRWGLPLNPEDMDELAYAVLRHASSNDDLDTITAAVEEQINEHQARAQQLRQAMQAHIERKHHGQGDATT